MAQMHKWVCSVILLTILNFENSDGEANRNRQGKFFNVFQVITFPNGPCIGSGNRNGTCYTEAECNSKGGTNGGTCASGFGVCCQITVGCGGRSMENCTYFESQGVQAGSCQAEICPCNDNICQLRLDLDTFMITGPTTAVNTVTKRRKNGGDVTVNAVDVGVSAFGQCLTDTFSVGNPEGPSPPTICGTNSGEHMYVESSECCNKLTFKLGSAANGAAIATRTWAIKVTQYSCDYPNLAPQGCTQYFFGPQNNVAGALGTMVQTFNYNNGNGIHLADQDQVICVRRERAMCRICWYTMLNTDFALTGSMSSSVQRNGNLCCDYGAPTASTMRGFDCLLIPFNMQPGANPLPRVSVFCGNNMGLKGGTQCSTRTPFVAHFRSDHWEGAPEAAIGGALRNRGFRLVYTMDAIGCTTAANMVAIAG